ncbi:hypothetical protein JZ751_019085, partial [Albula glossodonta]
MGIVNKFDRSLKRHLQADPEAKATASTSLLRHVLERLAPQRSPLERMLLLQSQDSDRDSVSSEHRRMQEEERSYRHKLQAFQEGQQRQAQLVQKLQTKVLQYKKRCGELEEQVLQKTSESEKHKLSLQAHLDSAAARLRRAEQEHGSDLQSKLSQLEEEQRRPTLEGNGKPGSELALGDSPCQARSGFTAPRKPPCLVSRSSVRAPFELLCSIDAATASPPGPHHPYSALARPPNMTRVTCLHWEGAPLIFLQRSEDSPPPPPPTVNKEHLRCAGLSQVNALLREQLEQAGAANHALTDSLRRAREEADQKDARLRREQE